MRARHRAAELFCFDLYIVRREDTDISRFDLQEDLWMRDEETLDFQSLPAWSARSCGGK